VVVIMSPLKIFPQPSGVLLPSLWELLSLLAAHRFESY
jgi:hypothetical protein